MSVSGNIEFDVDASPSVVMDLLRDVKALPDWSGPHKSVEIVEKNDDGLPKQVKLTVSMMGVTDNETLEYSWTDDSCTWKLVESDQLKSQEGTYTVAENSSGGSHVTFELEVDLKIKLPGLVVKQGQKKALDTAKEGLTKEAERRAS